MDRQPSRPPQPPDEASKKAALADLRRQIHEHGFSFLLIMQKNASPELETLASAMERRFPEDIVYPGKVFRAIKLDRATTWTASQDLGSTSVPRQ